MILQDTYTLTNGVTIPKMGLGTWFIDNDTADQAVRDATELGYRHFDTAQAYGNEAGIGEGMRSCGVAREQLFVTTKLDAGIKNYDEAVKAIDGSLATLGLEYVDLMLIHSPQPWTEFGESDRYPEGNSAAWRALEEAYQAGKLRAIGLSNFQQQDVDNILQSCSVKPMVNQILAHISNTPENLIQYNRDHDLLVEAYSPIGHGELFKNQSIAQFAEHYQVSVPQLCIRYLLQLGLLPLPKTANPAHMQTNADVDFVISDEDMAALRNMKTIEDYGEANAFPVYSGKPL